MIDKDLILDYSAPLRKFKTNDLKHEWKWNIEQRRFDFCFWHLYELDCGLSQSTFQLFDRLANTCKNIRILKIYICSSPHGDDVYYNLPKLMNLVLSENFKEAILIHSNSSINYYYNNGTHNLDSLLSNFRNLKSLRHRILMVLNKTLPKHLNTMIFWRGVTISLKNFNG